MKISSSPSIALAMILVVLAGCESDERIVKLSERSLERQAEQNQQIAQQSREVTAATRAVVEADAAARGELIATQQRLQLELQTERSSLDQQHRQLEAERRTLAASRHREPILAGAISGAALLAACILPLLICLYVLRALTPTEPELQLANVFVDELVTDTRLPILARRFSTKQLEGSESPTLLPPEP
jgi:hypothetical protein